MSREGFLLDIEGGRTLRMPARLTVVASQDALGHLEEGLEGASSEDLRLHGLEPAQAIPPEIIDDAQIIVVEVDPNEAASMERITQIGNRRPDLPMVVALADANIATVRLLLRRGVADVVSIPFRLEEMLEAAINAFEEAEKHHAPEVALCPMVAVVRARGGDGATAVTTHLASHLRDYASSGRGVCIIDLDIQSGQAAQALGLNPRRNLDDLFEAQGRLDRSILRTVAIDREDGIHLIAAPFEIHPLEQIDTDQLLEIIELARQEYDFVVLDMPANWTSWNLSALLGASQVLMVVEQDIASLRQAKRLLELFNSVGVRGENVSVVVNRVEKRLFSNISLRDVKEALSRDVLVGLPNEKGKLVAAQDQGLLLSELEGNNKFDAEMAKLAAALNDRFSREVDD